MKANNKGFTLIEILIAVVIVGILASMAIPAYQRYILKSHRTDAKTALMRMVAEQEKFYLQNNRYSTALADLGFPNSKSERGWYSLTVTPDDATNPQAFTMTAQAVSTAGQNRDTKCRSFSVDNLGRRTAQDSSSADQSDKCW